MYQLGLISNPRGGVTAISLSLTSLMAFTRFGLGIGAAIFNSSKCLRYWSKVCLSIGIIELWFYFLQLFPLWFFYVLNIQSRNIRNRSHRSNNEIAECVPCLRNDHK